MSARPGLRTLAILVSALSLASLVSCAPEAAPDQGYVPSGLAVPEALLSTGGTSRMLAGTTVPEGVLVFEPFRAALARAEGFRQIAEGLAEGIAESDIPDTWSGSSNGMTVKVDTNAGIRRIRLYALPGDLTPLLSFSYALGEPEGEFAYADAAGLISLRVTWDARVAGAKRLVIEADLPDDPTDVTTYPRTLYYSGTYGAAGVSVEGGLAYNYNFPDLTATATSVNEKRCYMYRARTDASGEKALAELYYPLDGATTVATASDSIDKAFASITKDWLLLPANADTATTLGVTADTDPASIITTLKALTDPPASLAFITDLANPIAWSGAGGFVANGADLTDPAYMALQAGLAAITWTKTPAEVAAISVSLAD